MQSINGETRHMQGPHAPEKIEKTKHLDQHARGGPFEKDEENATKEARRPTQLVLPRKKVERLLRTDDEKEAAQEQDLSVAKRSIAACVIVGGL